ncbi:hypothetical protein ACMU_05210 [Actibacterium mucosum KCTC 23349]|uniref:Uncharacterized protein n=1 Tax=Actibacterium mucosum KCTC 23349 TaxID=1454373 RepID=A0A037ZIU2_9RHOB|nr:hypothetical protein ACMU_05210 [Actibacterium mucosum KCTC 23349]
MTHDRDGLVIEDDTGNVEAQIIVVKNSNNQHHRYTEFVLSPFDTGPAAVMVHLKGISRPVGTRRAWFWQSLGWNCRLI